MKTIAIANQKGGTGKTTTAVNLGHSMASNRRHKARILIVDLDAQANCTTWLAGDDEEFAGRSSAEVLLRDKDIQECIVPTKFGIDLLPGHIAIASLDIDLSGEINRDLRLKKSLDLISDRYDYVLIDCPPSLGIVTINALAAADGVIVAIQTHSFPFEAVSRLMNTLRKVVIEYEKQIRILALPTLFDRTVIAKTVLDEIRTKFEHLTLSPIHKNTKLPEAAAARKPIQIYDPAAVGALDYQRVAKEVVDAISEGKEAKVWRGMEKHKN
jgi:chromosome partitioning protein